MFEFSALYIEVSCGALGPLSLGYHESPPNLEYNQLTIL